MIICSCSVLVLYKQICVGSMRLSNLSMKLSCLSLTLSTNLWIIPPERLILLKKCLYI